MRYRIYLDDVLINDEPRGLNDIEITIERDGDIKGLLVKFTSELDFIGDGYDAIKTKLDESITSTIEVLIQYEDGSGWTDLFEGLIFVSDVSFNLFKRIATTAIEDRSWSALINNNKAINAELAVKLSKNEVTITGGAEVELDFYDPVDALGTYFYPDIPCYTIDECFRFIIDFMTDGRVDYESSFFGVGGDGEGFVVVSGAVLSGTNNETGLVLNFKDLFMEVDYRFNISFKIDTSGATPKVVIEPVNDFYLDTDSVTLENPLDPIQEFDRARLYSVVEFGGDTVVPYNTLDNANYPSIPFYGHVKESYHVLGESNIDNTLSLVGRWVVDSNAIEQAVIGTSGSTTSTSAGKLVDSGASFQNGDVSVGMRVYNLTDGTDTTIDAIDSDTQLDLAVDIFTSGEDYKIATKTDFDDKTFIIQTDYPTNNRATKNDDFEANLSVYLYNVLLNNFNVSVNYFAGVHDSIASFLQEDTDNMRAAITGASLSYSSFATDVILWNDTVTNGYDTGGNYTSANGRYTVPVGGAGAYVVGSVFDYNLTGAPLTQIARVFLRQYNSGGTLLREELIETLQTGVPIIIFAGGSATFYANDGDYFTSEVDWDAAGTVTFLQASGWSLQPFSSFSVAQVASAPIAQIYNPGDFRGFMYSFEYPIGGTDWDTINENLSSRVNFTVRDETYKGWIEKLIYKHKKKLATIKLINTK